MSDQNFPKNLREAIDTKQWHTIAQVIENTMQNLPESQHANTLLKMGAMLRQCEPPQTHHAIMVFERAKACQTNPQQMAVVHAQLSELYAQLEVFEQATDYGNKTIALNEQIAMQYRPARKLVAFSLFGAKPEYCEMGILNAELMPQIYPDWQMVVYHNDSVPKHVLTRLAALGVELVDIKTVNAEHMPGTFWRFLALERDDCDVVIIRDIDSLISEREKVLVEEWLASDKPFHIIRDWYGHTDLILAGLWGARMGLLGNIRHWIDDFLQHSKTLHPTHADQHFLAQYIYPRIQDFALHHSSVFDYEQSSWPAQLPKDTKDVLPERLQLGAWQTTFLNFNFDKPFDVIFMENGQEICRYAYQAGEKCEVPRQYKTYLLSGKWQVHVLIEGQTIPIAIAAEKALGVARTTFTLNRDKKQLS